MIQTIPTNYMTSYIALRDELDAQITALESQVCELKRRRNHLAPIARLPPELLASVFIFYRNSCYSENPRKLYNLKWLSIAAVCSYWRTTALGTESLWSYIDFADDRSDRGLTMFSRAGGTPLSLQVLLKSGGDGQLRSYPPSECITQAKDLQIVGTLATSAKDRYSHLLESRAPILEKILIQSYTHHNGSFAWISWSFLTESTRLRDLTLSGCQILSGCGVLVSLETLRIDNCIFTLQDILAALSSMPTLTTLEMHYFVPADNPTTVVKPARILCLVNLKLSGCLSYCARFLQHIVTPNVLKWHMSSTSHDGDSQIEMLVSYATRYRDTMSRYGYVFQRAKILLHPGLWTSRITASWSSDQDLCIELRDIDDASWANPLWSALGFSEIPIVYLDGVWHEIATSWRNPEAFTSVETLVVCADEVQQSVPVEGSDWLVYPKLQKLIILEKPKGRALFSELEKWLRYRRDCGVGVEKLILQGSKQWHARCQAESNIIDTLREIVSEVRVEEQRATLPPESQKETRQVLGHT
jgi:hypothetical protein